MKMTTLKSVAIALGLASSAFGQATSPVVGYETLELNTGFNFAGVRLHEAPIVSGALTGVTATTATDSSIADFGAFLEVGESYVLEIEDGSGIIQVVDSFSGSNLNVADLSGVTGSPSYTLRPLSNLSTVFGSTSAAVQLDQGQGNSSGADQVLIFNGSDFNRYYFDGAFFNLSTFENEESWIDVTDPTDPTPVDGGDIDLLYSDSFLIASAAGADVTIAGDLKTGPTEVPINIGFNFVASAGPVGINLVSTFGSSVAEVPLAQGSGNSSGADQVLIFDGSNFSRYYFDSAFFNLETFVNEETWIDVTDPENPTPVDGGTISLPSGYLLVGAVEGNAIQEVPTFYNGL